MSIWEWIFGRGEKHPEDNHERRCYKTDSETRRRQLSEVAREAEETSEDVSAAVTGSMLPKHRQRRRANGSVE